MMLLIFQVVFLLPLFEQQHIEDDQSLSRLTKAEELKSLVSALCSPQYEGRYTGTDEFTRCAQWAASRFKEWGLQSGIGSNFLQEFPAPHSIINEMSMTLLLPKKAGSSMVSIQAGEGFLPLLFADTCDRTASTAFVGWGVDAPELGYSDYSKLNVQNRFVLCLRGVPDYEDRRFWKHDYHSARMQTAKKHGALGLFYVSETVLANPNGKRIPGFTPAMITKKVADQLLKANGKTSEELQKALSESKQPQSFLLDSQVHLRVSADYFPDGRGYNVVGVVPGSDPQRKDECVVVGAHLDHCGKHENFVFPGALDNASGSAAVMAMARAYSVLKTKPKRSVLFVLFGGEEMGLLGSRHFVKNLPESFKKVTCMLNLDMVGWGEGTDIMFHPKYPELAELVEKANTDETIRHIWAVDYVTPRSSDFAPFLQEGIPYVNFFATDPYEHYHGPGDTPEHVDYEQLLKVTKVAMSVSYEWADRD